MARRAQAHRFAGARLRRRETVGAFPGRVRQRAASMVGLGDQLAPCRRTREQQVDGPRQRVGRGVLPGQEDGEQVADHFVLGERRLRSGRVRRRSSLRQRRPATPRRFRGAVCSAGSRANCSFAAAISSRSMPWITARSRSNAWSAGKAKIAPIGEHGVQPPVDHRQHLLQVRIQVVVLLLDGVGTSTPNASPATASTA